MFLFSLLVILFIFHCSFSFCFYLLDGSVVIFMFFIFFHSSSFLAFYVIVGVGPFFSGLGLALPFKVRRRRPGSAQKGRGGPTLEERRANAHPQERMGS